MKGRRLATVPTCAALLAMAIGAGARAQQLPAFRAGTALVQVDAVVHDKAGRFVPDLTAADFEVLDDGRPRPADLVALVRSNSETEPSATPSASAAAPWAPAAARHRVFVAVFDDDHLTPGGFKRVQAAAKSLFERSFRQGDVGGVVARGEMVNRRLTSDRDELLKDVAGATPSGSSGSRLSDERVWPRMSEVEAIGIRVTNDDQVFQAVLSRACTDEPDACARMDVGGLIRNKATQMAALARAESEKLLRTVEALFTGLQRFTGPKVVLLLTEGFVAEESWPIVEQTVAAAAKADARVYTLDARALDRTGLGDRLTGSDPGNNDVYAMLLRQMDPEGDPMNSLAVDTGGFVVRNTNYFDEAVARIADEAGTYYLIGFRPTTMDGRFHRLTVRVKRPALTVRARRGYIATGRALPAIEALATPIAPATLPGKVAVEDAPVAPASPTASAATVAASAASTAPVPGSRVTTAGTIARLRPDAVQHAASLAANAPRDDDATRGWNAYQRGDLESARKSLAAAAAKADARPWVSYALGQAQYGLRSYREASTAWERVRATVPEFEPVYFDLVDAYLQLKEYDRASALMREAAKRWPSDADVYEARGVVEIKRDALDDAVKSFQEAIAKAPDDATGYFNLANALELRYVHSRRWVAVAHRWYYNEHDRGAAVENYKRCVALGGPLADAAKAALKRLEWDK